MLDDSSLRQQNMSSKLLWKRINQRGWLKSVSAFANGIGGTLFFGVSDDRTITRSG